jgi:hypothetical protein
MTPVGKILAFLNLAFSFVVGALALFTYTARTHWATQYQDLSQKFAVVQGTANTYKAEADRLAQERQKYNDELFRAGRAVLMLKPAKDAREAEQEAQRAAQEAVKLLQDRNREIAKLKDDKDRADKDLAAARRAIVGYETGMTSSQSDVQRRQQDVERIREILKVETTKNTQLTRDMNDMRSEMVAAQIQARSLRDRNVALEGQLQDMARDLARLRSAPGAGSGVARGTTPPPEHVEGVIRRAEGRLATLSIGSDAGLTKGNTLEVFRFGANPRYIGRVRIVDVSAHQAVAQVEGKLTAPMQSGDTVASSIMGGRR